MRGAQRRTRSAGRSRIPLGKEALAVVALCRAKSEQFLFPAYKGKPLSDAAMATLMKRNGYEARPHGFRALWVMRWIWASSRHTSVRTAPQTSRAPGTMDEVLARVAQPLAFLRWRQ